MFTLAISCLITSSLPWFLNLTFQIPMWYCSLQHWTLLSLPDICSWVPFPLWHSKFILSGAISNCPPPFSCSTLDTFWPGGDHLWCHIFLPFYTVHRVLAARILEWFAIPSSVDHVLSELSTVTRPSWVALHGMAHGFIGLCKPLCYDKAVTHEWVQIVTRYKSRLFSWGWRAASSPLCTLAS